MGAGVVAVGVVGAGVVGAGVVPGAAVVKSNTGILPLYIFSITTPSIAVLSILILPI